MIPVSISRRWATRRICVGWISRGWFLATTRRKVRLSVHHIRMASKLWIIWSMIFLSIRLTDWLFGRLFRLWLMANGFLCSRFRLRREISWWHGKGLRIVVMGRASSRWINPKWMRFADKLRLRIDRMRLFRMRRLMTLMKLPLPRYGRCSRRYITVFRSRRSISGLTKNFSANASWWSTSNCAGPQSFFLAKCSAIVQDVQQ